MIFVIWLYISPRTILRNVTPCIFSDGYQRCRVMCCQHLHGRITWKRERRIIYSRDGQNIFVRNAGVYLWNFTELVLSSFCFCVILLSFFLHLFILLQIFSFQFFLFMLPHPFLSCFPHCFMFLLFIFLSFFRVFLFRGNKFMWGRDCFSKFERDTVCIIDIFAFFLLSFKIFRGRISFEVY